MGGGLGGGGGWGGNTYLILQYRKWHGICAWHGFKISRKYQISHVKLTTWKISKEVITEWRREDKKRMVKATVYEALDVLTMTKVSVTLLALISSSIVDAGDNLCDPECREDDQVCCGGSCVLGSSCLGLSCRSHQDCLNAQNCCSNACVNQTNCLGQNCSSHSDCTSDESCCDRRYYSQQKKCKSGDSCAGLSCISDDDCGAGEFCCGNECVWYHCGAVTISLFILAPCFGGTFICVVFVYCVVLHERWKEARVNRNNRARRETIAQRSSPRLGRSSLSTTDHNDYCYTSPLHLQIIPTELSELPSPGASAQTETSLQSNDPQSLPPCDWRSPSYLLIVPYEQIPPMETSLSTPPPPGASTQTELVTAQNNSPHLGQSPPPYEQSSLNYSPPPYKQIAHIEASRPPPPSPGVSAQTETASQSPPPYEPNTPTEPNEPPPPYSEEQEGIPGGVSTSQNTYQGTEPTNYALTVWV